MDFQMKSITLDHEKFRSLKNMVLLSKLKVRKNVFVLVTIKLSLFSILFHGSGLRTNVQLLSLFFVFSFIQFIMIYNISKLLFVIF